MDGDHVEAVVQAEGACEAEGAEADHTGDEADVDRRHPATNPAHGVMATSPATAPDAAPIVVARPLRSRSTISQPSIAADGARNVFMMAWAATPLAARAEPALNPAHRNHKMPVPNTVRRTL